MLRHCDVRRKTSWSRERSPEGVFLLGTVGESNRSAAEATSDGFQLEPMHSVIGAQRQVESLKTAVEDQVEGVLDSLCLLFGLSSADELKLSSMFEVPCGS
jgi:hypothetical protein